MQNLESKQSELWEIENLFSSDWKELVKIIFVDHLLSKSARIAGIPGEILSIVSFIMKDVFNILLLQSRFIARDTSRRLKNMNSSGRNYKVRPSKR